MGTAHITRTILRFLVFGAVGSLLSTGQVLASNIGTPTVTPDSLVAGVATPVTVPVLVSPASSSLYPGQRFAVGASPSSVAVADVNGDGRLDLVTANNGFFSGDVSVLLGAEEGVFQAGQPFAVGASPSSVAVADVNGDGRLDLVTANASFFSGDVSVLLGAEEGVF